MSKKTNNEKLDGFIHEILNNLANEMKKNNSIFLSEADFQFCFAQKLLEKGVDRNSIILEYPIKTQDLYENSKECLDCKKENDNRTYIDLSFQFNNEICFIEFKYKLDDISEEITRHHCTTQIKKQGAEYIGRHHVYEDIERMENILSKKEINGKKVHSYVILLTNDKQYWNKNQSEGQTTFYFPLSPEDGCVNCNNTKYTKCNEDGKDGKYLCYNSKANNKPGELHIKHRYELAWSDFITLKKVKKNGEFRILVINCNDPL